MKFLLQQYDFRPQNGGGIVHSRQFVRNLHALGHETCAWSGAQGTSEGIRGLANRRQFIRAWATADCVYHRVTTRCPRSRVPFLSRILGARPVRVWEFNAVPEFALCKGDTPRAVEAEKEIFRARRKECDLAVCVSPAIAGYVESELGIERTCVASNASDPSRFHPGVRPNARMNRFRGCFNVCWIGSWELSWHRTDLVISAAQELAASQAGADIQFHILGKASGGEKMPANVHFHGNVPYENLPSWLAAMQVGLVTYGEGPGQYSSPLKLFDYCAMGLPVVSFPQKQVESILHDLDLGDYLIVREYSGEALARKLIELSCDQELIARCRRMLPELIQNTYNWRNTVGNICREVESLRRS